MIKKQISGASDINDTILLQRFKKFKENPINCNCKDDDDDNNNDGRINPAGPALPPPTFSDFPSFFRKPNPPPPPPPQMFFSTTQLPTQPPPIQNKPNIFDKFSFTPITPSEQVMSEIERVVEKEKVKEEVEQITPSDPLLEYFNNADQILNTNFILHKEKDEADLKNFKRKYQIDTLTDEID